MDTVEQKPRNLGNWMQNIDRRYLYLALLALIVFGLVVPIPLPLSITPPAKDLFDVIEKMPTNKIAVISTNWSASTQGENRPQTRVILTHLMHRRIKFALMAFDPQSTLLAQELAEELGREYHYVYGRDWINWGYRPQVETTLKGIVRDIQDTYKTDSKNRQPLSTYPVMAGVRSLKDVGVIVEVSPSGTHRAWAQLVVGTVEAPYGFCPTSVMGPEVFNYYDAGQIKGILFGIKGAAEYEKLLVQHRILKKAGFTTRAITPVSLSLILLFVLIGLGNYGTYVARRQERRG